MTGGRRLQDSHEKRDEEQRVLHHPLLRPFRKSVHVRHEVEKSQKRGEVGADRHEPRVPERELSGVRADDVERYRQDDVDAHQHDDSLVVNDSCDVDGAKAVRGADQDRDEDRRVEKIAQPPGKTLQTFSASYFPNNPDGRKRRMTIRITKAIAGVKFEKRLLPTNASISPMISPPTTAPGTLPIPPNTAAMNAFSPGRLPISGSIFEYRRTYRIPATAASADPITNALEMKH